MIVHRDKPLSDLVWYRIGGPARYVLDVGNLADVYQAVEFIERHRPARILVIGMGSNLVFPDTYFDGAVIRIAGERTVQLRRQGRESFEVFAGSLLDDVARSSLDERLIGLEWAGGLPGTIGAAIRGNVGAFGHEIGQGLQQAEIVVFEEHGWQTRTLDRSNLQFSYRESRVKREQNWIVAMATLHLQPATYSDVEAARAEYRRNIDYRRQRHPMENPSCGSVFKNLDHEPMIERVLDYWPDIEEKVRTSWHGKVPMGLIIGRLGLAGLRSGGAQISRKHHNFIVNRGGARASDVHSLIGRVQGAIENLFGFVPELEIDLIE